MSAGAHVRTSQIVWGVLAGMWLFAVTFGLFAWFVIAQIHANSYFFNR